MVMGWQSCWLSSNSTYSPGRIMEEGEELRMKDYCTMKMERNEEKR